MNKKNIIIAAGGTGGHIVPALAIAKEFTKNYNIIWLGSVHGMENELVKNYPIKRVNAVGLRGKGLKHLLTAPFKILTAILQSYWIIKQNQAKLVVTMGGFVGGIGGLASILARTKFIIHEQNGVAGTSNKWLNKFSFKSFQAFDNTLKNAITCGNPLNWEVQPKTSINTPLNLLVLGGSLGAKSINAIVPQLKTQLNILHQTGNKHFHNVKEFATTSIKTIDFIDDMATAYAWADVVIARGGAMTISELIQTKSIAILIPYPFAIDNHQLINAKILTSKGCGFLVEEQDGLAVEKIDAILGGLTAKKITVLYGKFSQFKNKKTVKLIADEVHQVFANNPLYE